MIPTYTSPLQRKPLKEGIAALYDESSGLWESMWGEHMHHGFYPKGSPPKSNQQAQIDMIEEVLSFAGVDKVDKVGSQDSKHEAASKAMRSLGLTALRSCLERGSLQGQGWQARESQLPDPRPPDTHLSASTHSCTPDEMHSPHVGVPIPPPCSRECVHVCTHTCTLPHAHSMQIPECRWWMWAAALGGAAATCRASTGAARRASR